MPAARARLTLSSLRPSSEVMTCRPFSVSRLPTAAPMLPGAINATTGFIDELLFLTTRRANGEWRIANRGERSLGGRRDCLPFAIRHSLFAATSLHSISREFLRDIRLDRLGGGNVRVAARIVFLQLRHAAPVKRARVLRLVAQNGGVVGDGAVELAGLEAREGADDEGISLARLQLHHFIAVGKRGRQFAGNRAGPAFAGPRGRVRGRELDRLAVIGDG